MVDIHSHILYDIADSPTSIEISLEIAKQYIKCGFTHIVSTPHYNPSNEDSNSFLLKCDDKYNKLNDLLYQSNLTLSIIPGAEVTLCPELLNIRNLNRLCIANSTYMIVELPWNQFPYWTQSILYELELRKITPILAHPERNQGIYKHYDKFTKLIESGLLIQIDAFSLFEGRTCKKIIRRLFRDDAVSFIATDTHLPDRRLLCFNKALSVSKKRYGESRTNRILNNSSLVINNCLINY